MKNRKIKMKKSDFMKEHKHLDRILVEGTKKERLNEAKKQKKEMKKYSRL